MSCRVQRKRVEQAFFAWLSVRAWLERGAKTVRVAYTPTEPQRRGAERCWRSLGFHAFARTPPSGSRPSTADAIPESDIVVLSSRGIRRQEPLKEFRHEPSDGKTEPADHPPPTA